MNRRTKEIEEFIKKYSKGEYIEEAQKFTVDSGGLLTHSGYKSYTTRSKAS